MLTSLISLILILVEEEIIGTNHQQGIVRQVPCTWCNKAEELLPVGFLHCRTIFLQFVFRQLKVVADVTQVLCLDVSA